MDHAPILTEDQLRRLRPAAKARQVVAGDVLYQPNDDTPSIYVIVSGALKISYLSAGQEHVFMTYGPGQFFWRSPHDLRQEIHLSLCRSGKRERCWRSLPASCGH